MVLSPILVLALVLLLVVAARVVVDRARRGGDAVERPRPPIVWQGGMRRLTEDAARRMTDASFEKHSK